MKKCHALLSRLVDINVLTCWLRTDLRRREGVSHSERISFESAHGCESDRRESAHDCECGRRDGACRAALARVLIEPTHYSTVMERRANGGA